MPTQAFHRNYWENSSTAVAPIVVSQGGYPQWQRASVGFYLGSLFGSLQAVWDRLAWVVSTAWHTRTLDAHQRFAVTKAVKLVRHDGFPLAHKSILRVSKTLHFNRPEAWSELNRALKADPGQAENTFRHLQACHYVTANTVSSTLSHPDLHLIVELAYHGWSRHGDV